MLDCDVIICNVISNPLFPRDQVCTFTSTGSPTSVSPNIRGQILWQKVCKCSQHFLRSHPMARQFNNRKLLEPNVKILHTPRNHIHGEQICQTENGFNLACICHFLPLSCPWTKLLSTISKQPFTWLQDANNSYNIDDHYDDGIVYTVHDINK